MRPPRPFVFRSCWRLPAAPSAVYDTLADAVGYPRWWPQVRRAHPLDAGHTSGECVIRSFLPMPLHLRLDQEVADPSAGLLRAQMTGDLAGWCAWEVQASGGGALVTFRQECVVAAPLLRVAASGPLRPLLVANHAWMMRGGRRGLARHLA